MQLHDIGDDNLRIIDAEREREWQEIEGEETCVVDFVLVLDQVSSRCIAAAAHTLPCSPATHTQTMIYWIVVASTNEGRHSQGRNKLQKR